ncbi:putative lipid II flippase FtsW [candidate division KSB1 bacterium]|nr:putative lipid II flippase FtsW [candidate division KSB1 bacterium]
MRQGFDTWLLIAVLLLVLCSVCFVYTASSAKAERNYDDSAFFLKRQLVRLLLGLIAMFVISRVDYHDILARAPLLYGVSLILLIVLLLLPESMAIRGSRRWFVYGPLQVQPSELAKFCLIFYLAANLAKTQIDVRNFMDGLMPQLVLIGATALAVVLEPDMGTTLIIATVGMFMLFLHGARLQHLFALVSTGVLVAIALLLRVEYQRDRVESFLASVFGAAEPGWQVKQSLIGLGDGGLLGLGLGKSKQKLLFLPDPHTDFIMSIIGEEMGLIGTLGVLLLFFIILWRGFRIAQAAPDASGRLTAFGVTLAIGLSAFVNIAVITNLLPTTGIPLPFVSYGGSSLIVHLAAVGVLLNISQSVKPKKAGGVTKIPLARTKWYHDRKR